MAETTTVDVSNTLPNSLHVIQKSLVWTFPKQLGGFTLHGNSWACDTTAFQIPELAWALDSGFVAHPQRRTHVFLTHAHGDHSTSLPFFICRRVPPTIFLPTVTMEAARAYLDAHLDFRLHGQDLGGERLPTYFLNGVDGGNKINLTAKPHADKVIEVFHCYHSVACVGYGFLQKKKKLKDEYVGVEGRQLGLLRKQGVQLDNVYEAPMFAFMGDTTVRLYEEQAQLESEGKENIFRYPLIITECTFLGTDKDDEERAKKTMHTLWVDLKPFVVSHPNVVFVLIHFSHRYSEEDIRVFFRNEGLANVVPFVEDEATNVVQQKSELGDEY